MAEAQPDDSLQATLKQLVEESLREGIGLVEVGEHGGAKTKTPNQKSKTVTSSGPQKPATTSGHSAGPSKQPTISQGAEQQSQQIANMVVQQLIPTLTQVVAQAVSTAVSAAVAAVADQITVTVTEKIRGDFDQRTLLLRYEQDKLEQYSRRESIRITGVADEKEENVAEKIIQLAKDMDVDIVSSDISVCHRSGQLRENAKKPRDILCRFISRSTKHSMMRNKKQLKEKDGYKGVYVNDDLTPMRAKMLRYIKEQHITRALYTSEGRICCYLRDNHPGPRPIVVESPDDLFRLGLDDVDLATLGLGNFI